jgi:hypothetical protein
VRPRRKPRSLRPVGVEVEVISRPFRAAHIGAPQLRHRYAAYTHTSHAAGRVVLGSTLVRMAPTGRDACLQSVSAQCRRGGSDHPAAEDVDRTATPLCEGGEESQCGSPRTSSASPGRSSRERLPELLGHDDSATAQRVTQALFGMKTIVIADLEAAAVYEPSVRRIASALFALAAAGPCTPRPSASEPLRTGVKLPSNCEPFSGADLATAPRVNTALTRRDDSAPRGNRTPNPLIKSQLLCQLS